KINISSSLSFPGQNNTKEQNPVVLASRGEKEQKPDGSWNKGPVQLPDVDRPDEFLATLGLVPGEEEDESLWVAAEAALEAEGHNRFFTIRPITQARMIQLLLRDGVMPTLSTALA